MKRFHEVAHVKEGNKRVGYFLKQGDVTQVGAWYYCSQEDFCKLVRQHQVQYFEPDSSGMPYIVYSDEELAVLRTFNADNAAYTGKDYWKYDMSFTKAHIDTLNSDASTVIICPLNISKVMFQKVVVCTFLFNNSIGIPLTQSLSRLLPLIKTTQVASNNFAVPIPEVYLKSNNNIIERLRVLGFNVVTDCNTLLRTLDNTSEVVNKNVGKPFIKPSTLRENKDILSILQRYE